MGFADARVLENRGVKQNATPIEAGGEFTFGN
jgi:xyloglucan fucosyltransferase